MAYLVERENAPVRPLAYRPTVTGTARDHRLELLDIWHVAETGRLRNGEIPVTMNWDTITMRAYALMDALQPKLVA